MEFSSEFLPREMDFLSSVSIGFLVSIPIGKKHIKIICGILGLSSDVRQGQGLMHYESIFGPRTDPTNENPA